MFKKSITILCLIVCSNTLIARHIAGGELYYKALGDGAAPNTIKYQISLRLFRDCNSSGPELILENVFVGIYENGIRIANLELAVVQNLTTIRLDVSNFICLVGAPNVCYEYMVWSKEIDLPKNAVGYILTRNSCCRIENITNIQGSSIGATYTTKIPGTSSLPFGTNNSPVFNLKDTALVCAGKNFELDFGAVDDNKDSLLFSFCTPYGGSRADVPPMDLTLNPLNFSSNFSAGSPLGSGVVINPITGVISGIAPASGTYVVSVCIVEFRNGIAFTEHRKDFILKVQSCDFIEADLPSKIINCSSFTQLFENQSTSSSIIKYFWDFGVQNISTDTSSLPTPTFTYADTGKYVVKLKVVGPKDCTGEDSTIVLVYPGFDAKFTFEGRCFKVPFSFTDSSFARYGKINNWKWDFGEPAIFTDTSSKQHPKYLFSTVGNYSTRLIVESSVGCVDTTTVDLLASDKPFVKLPFKDTLICSIDSLLVPVQTSAASIKWSPALFISNANISNPIVFPKDTIQYFIKTKEDICEGIDTITINVIDSVTVKIKPDTTICKTDVIQLFPQSIALYYKWNTNTSELVKPVKNPFVKPLANTTYSVHASVGKCFDEESTKVFSIPYPISNAGADTAICFGDKAFINATMVASSFNWLPKSTIFPQNNSLAIQAAPAISTKYFLRVSDTLGCPKPVFDTVEIKVVQLPKIFAGNDTSIVVNQPMKFNGIIYDDESGIKVIWKPSLFLNNPFIYNPLGVFNGSQDSITYTFVVSTSIGCTSTDNVTVVIFKTNPDIFVPTAFTPNNDTRNDIIKAIPIGISKFEYFNIYNRLGNLIFSTPSHEKGWDGNVNGIKQAAGTYVFVTQGVDYLGKKIFKKGTFVLIR
jgi:gliding motility-associated-like protein